MGSEQSQPVGNPGLNQNASGSRPPRLVRGHTIAVPEKSREPIPGTNLENSGNISPGPSVCSDSDLPYISYTVNRPIGDSPKLTNKNKKSLVRAKSSTSAAKKPSNSLANNKNKSKAHNIVVVRPGVRDPSAEKDTEIMRLQEIPMFLPVMRGTLTLPSNRDPEVLERLQPLPLQTLCSKLQAHFTACANITATEQGVITQKIRETDAEVSRLMTTLTDKQKRYAKYAEKLSKVHEMSHQLNRCHMMLNQTMESMETLNNLLDVEDRLEPFVWTTG